MNKTRNFSNLFPKQILYLHRVVVFGIQFVYLAVQLMSIFCINHLQQFHAGLFRFDTLHVKYNTAKPVCQQKQRRGWLGSFKLKELLICCHELEFCLLSTEKKLIAPRARYLIVALFSRSLRNERVLFWIRCELFAQWSYYPMKRALVTTMATRCATGKQSRENMFFKYRKNNRQQDQTLFRFITNRNTRRLQCF